MMGLVLKLRRCAALALVASFWFCASASRAQMPFFNGAEGFGGTMMGTMPTGGWFANAKIYHVTTTADVLGPNGKPADGTLRRAFLDDQYKEQGGNVIIVFDVGGTFVLTEGSLDIKNISNYYVAGQTAPSPVTVYGDTTQVTHSSGKQTTNIAVRYMNFRKGTGDGEDAMTFAGSGFGSNLIFDHLSASWAEDEIMSVTNNNTNVSIQYSMINDALVSGHAYGSLFRAKIDSNVSAHHNLYANNASRQARFGSYEAETLTADFRNNIIYNYRDRASYAGGSNESEQESANVNFVGNYVVAGPGTGSKPSDYGGEYVFRVDKNIDAQVYQSGNYLDADYGPGGDPADNVLDGADNGTSMFVVTTPVTDQTLTFVGSPFATPNVTTQTAPQAYDHVVDYVGNWWWDRAANPIDARVIDNVTNFTGVPLGAAGPIPSELNGVQTAPTTSHPANWDTDNDGMPNYWELEHGLNPNSAADAVTYNPSNPSQNDFDLDGYTNLQEYLDDIGAFPCPAPIDYVGPTSGAAARYAMINHWKTNDGITSGSFWQPSRFDTARIFSGTVRVDAVGQHAGTLLVAPGATNATLNVLSGWIKVADDLVVGGGTGAGTLIVAAGGDVYADNVIIEATGRLQGVGEVIGDVWNNGLTTPGVTASPIGTLSIDGHYLQGDDGILRMEINSPSSYDRLDVEGTFFAGGTLDIVLGYSPMVGDTFSLLEFDAAEGAMLFNPPSLDPGLAWNYDNLFVNGTLSVVSAAVVEDADFNDDDMVDGLDFLIWQQNYNTAGGLAEGDANESGFVDADDLAIWEAQYGTSGGGLAAPVSVPEPVSVVLVLLAAAMSCRRFL